MIANHLAIIGLGLIGGSLARALRSVGAVGHVSGFDVDERQREDALRLGVTDGAAETAAQAVAGADVVVLAVPVLETAAALESCKSGLAAGSVLTDVGSTKAFVIQAVAGVFGQAPANYVPAHPIAGTEKSGVAASDGALFQRHRVVITPHDNMAEAAGARVKSLWEAAGAQVDVMSPTHHDAIFAATSHLPHVLAYTLVDMLARLDSSAELFNYGAGGFRDFTRIAGSSPKMWHDIVRANRDAVLPLMDDYLAHLGELRDAVAADDGAAVLACFTRARAARQRFPQTAQHGKGTR